jgi:RNA polymerase sigma-70 factor (ECF subfamily)
MDEPPALHPDPDRGLLADLREEKPGAVERFFRRFWPVALAYARALGDEAEAEDAAIEGIEDALRGLPGFRGDCRLSTWVIGILRHRVGRHLRARRRRPDLVLPAPGDEPADPRPGPAEAHAARREVEQLLADLARIPAARAEAVRLRHLLGLELAEVAAVLKLSPAAAGMRVTRGVADLRRLRQERLRREE